MFPDGLLTGTNVMPFGSSTPGPRVPMSAKSTMSTRSNASVSSVASNASTTSTVHIASRGHNTLDSSGQKEFTEDDLDRVQMHLERALDINTQRGSMLLLCNDLHCDHGR